MPLFSTNCTLLLQKGSVLLWHSVSFCKISNQTVKVFESPTYLNLNVHILLKNPIFVTIFIIFVATKSYPIPVTFVRQFVTIYVKHFFFSSERFMTEGRGINLSNGYKKASTMIAPITIVIIVLATLALVLLVAILYTYRVKCVDVRKYP